MSYQYNTLDEATAAVDAAIRDTLGDNPEVGEDDVAHDMVLAIAAMCPPEVSRELQRTQLGWIEE